MNHKQMPRLGSAIASTILSVFSAVSLVGVDKAQAALLTYNIDGLSPYLSFTASSQGISYFKVDNSSVTGIGYEGSEYIPVSEGRLYQYTLGDREYYDLEGLGARALFYQREFRGLYARGADYWTQTTIFSPDVQGGPLYIERSMSISWSLDNRFGDFRVLGDYTESTDYNGNPAQRKSLVFRSSPITYTLVNTEPSPVVPEPLTAGGTALALAGLSWLKHKKKMAA
jgi:hypothetical protein